MVLGVGQQPVERVADVVEILYSARNFFGMEALLKRRIEMIEHIGKCGGFQKGFFLLVGGDSVDKLGVGFEFFLEDIPGRLIAQRPLRLSGRILESLEDKRRKGALQKGPILFLERQENILATQKIVGQNATLRLLGFRVGLMTRLDLLQDADKRLNEGLETGKEGIAEARLQKGKLCLGAQIVGGLPQRLNSAFDAGKAIIKFQNDAVEVAGRTAAENMIDAIGKGIVADGAEGIVGIGVLVFHFILPVKLRDKAIQNFFREDAQFVFVRQAEVCRQPEVFKMGAHDLQIE